jgi:hypothetical protein
VVLAASEEGLESTVARLLDLVSFNADYALADCLLQPALALCPTGVADEPVEAELDTSGAPAAATEEGGAAEEGGPVTEGEYIAELDASLQGAIGLDESKEASLAADEAHAWRFSEGPATIDIVLETADEDMDGVLELYDADYNVLEAADESFSGEAERLSGIEIADDGDYYVVVRDFFGAGGDYTLSLTTGEASSTGGTSIFIFGDDKGTAAAGGFTSVDALATLVPETYTVTTWIASQDGPLQDDTLAGYDLVIWSSGDYRNQGSTVDEDTLIIFDYFLNGGSLFVVGATPPFLETEEVEVAALADLEVAEEAGEVLPDFEAGEVIALDQSYEASVIDQTDLTDEEGTTLLFVRGPESNLAGNVAGLSLMDELSSARLVLITAPFVAFPGAAQELLFDDVLAWYGLN